MKVDIFKMLEMWLGILDSKVSLLVSLLGSHDVSVVVSVSCEMSYKGATSEPISQQAGVLTYATHEEVCSHWCNIVFLLRQDSRGSSGVQAQLRVAA